MKTSRIVTMVAAAAVCAVASHAQTPVFGQRTYTGLYTNTHADLNNDGREDLVYQTQTGFAVVLSTADATYAAPVSYTVPDSQPSGIVTLDMNNDGKLDVIAYNGFAPGFYEYLNTGDGAFHLQSTYEMANIQDMVVGDFNHDGYPDIAFITVGPGNGSTLHVWFNNHAKGFSIGPSTTFPILGQMSTGDFDGDGNADIAMTCDQGTYLGFGNNKGNFTVVKATTAHQPYYFLMDIDGDGKSDLVGAAVAGTDGQYDTFYRDIFVVYGNAARTITESAIPLNGYAVAWAYNTVAGETPSVDVADFNGDGKRDFAIVEAQDNTGFGTRTLVVKPGNGNRTWGDEVNVYSNSNMDFGVAALRPAQSLKPGLLVDSFTSSGNTVEYNAHFFVNDTSGGYFGGCEFPDTATGIKVCSPTTYNSTSAAFSASAAGQTTMRKLEVWVDGVKKYEELARHDFSNYGLMDTTLSLSPGTHNVTIYAAGYDNLEQKKSYTITVK